MIVYIYEFIKSVERKLYNKCSLWYILNKEISEPMCW